MKKYGLLFFYFISLCADATYECISLGETCTVAAILQSLGLRNAAYPFDWVISPYIPLCNVLQNNFDDFLHSSFLYPRDDNRGVINKYGFTFVHDFPTIYYSGNLATEDTVGENVLHPEWITFLPVIQKKYDRRIQRLHNACNDNKKIYFIRHGGINSQQEACNLRDILKELYPQTDFTLVIVGNNTYFAQNWNELNIKNYYLHNTGIWNDSTEWERIFIDLGLLNPKTVQI